MNAGLIFVGVSHESGDAFRVDLEETDILADLEPYDHGSFGDRGGTIHDVLHVHTPSSTMHPQLA